MNSEQLNYLCTKDPEISEYFQGVYSLDEFMSIAVSNFDFYSSNICIHNVQKSNQPGSHWILYFFDVENKNICWFDSFAKSPEFYSFELKEFLFTLSSNQDTPTSTAPFQIQNSKSKLCGLYCVFLAKQLIKAPKSDLKTLISKNFDPSDTVSNDRKILSWFKGKFGLNILKNCSKEDCFGFEKLYNYGFWNSN